ncbi:MAG: hypothetical protein LBD30_00340 [Verrucomicrobiales bacterium]|jgi:predicted DNA binding CopG/RHH family protein|nr:hypothetical protein [Verrucomicrobiales bacterium]
MSKVKRDKDGYEYDSEDFRTEDVEGVPILTRAEEAMLGIPSPEEFAKMARTSNINLTLSARALDFFKAAAKKERVPYQGLIRAALEFHVNRALAGKSTA